VDGRHVYGVTQSYAEDSAPEVSLTLPEEEGEYGLYDYGNTVEGNVCDGNEQAGVYAELNSLVLDNYCRANKESGIQTGRCCTIRGNLCNDNIGTTDGYGIRADSGCTITGNNCVGNKGALNKRARGIYCKNKCDVRDNKCTDTSAEGSGSAVGIYVDGYDCRIEGNHVTGCSGSASDFGIYLKGNQNVVIENTCSSNEDEDISFGSSTSGGYAAGNLTQKAISDGGSNNESGTTPAANATF